MKNTLTNKEIYFGKYYNQKVFNGEYLVTLISRINKFDYLSLYSISNLTDKDAIEICQSIGLANAAVFQRNKDYIMVVDDSYTISFYTNGVILMYKNTTPYWNDIQKLYSETIARGYYMGDGSEIKYGWVEIK